MNTTIGCPIPGASQPKEPVRLIDIKEILQYDGAHFTWSGGKNLLSEQKAAYARGYDAGMKFIVDEAKKAPVIDPESLRTTARWKHGGIDGNSYTVNWICRKCGKVADFDYKYCPNCGARMEGRRYE